MNDSPIFQRFLNAQTALKATIQKILDLNRQLKSIRAHRKAPETQDIRQELKLLNKMADQQAKIVNLYERHLKKAANQ
jgi:hypothetical protein